MRLVEVGVAHAFLAPDAYQIKDSTPAQMVRRGPGDVTRQRWDPNALRTLELERTRQRVATPPVEGKDPEP